MPIALWWESLVRWTSCAACEMDEASVEASARRDIPQSVEPGWLRPLRPTGLVAWSDPDGIRTRVAALKGPCPRPLDDGATPLRGNLILVSCPEPSSYRRLTSAHRLRSRRGR